MKKELLLGSAVLVLALVGIVLFSALRPAPAKAPGTAATATTTLPEFGPYLEHGQHFDIAINYPTTTPFAGAADVTARAAMRAWAADVVTQFKQDGNFANLTPNDMHVMGYDQGRKQTLQVLYLQGSGPATVSYIYTEYLDTLGAHPNVFFKTFTFNKTTGALLALSDVFTGDYLATLSADSRTALAQSLRDLAVPSMIADGTKPVAENFQNWFFDNQDFVIVFPPYQVAAYAAGPQTVRIPVKNLDSILQPAYRQ